MFNLLFFKPFEASLSGDNTATALQELFINIVKPFIWNLAFQTNLASIPQAIANHCSKNNNASRHPPTPPSHKDTTPIRN